MKYLVVLLSLLLGAVFAQDSVVISPQSIVINPKPSFNVEVFVDRDASGDRTPSYTIGDEIRIGVRSSADTYIYLFNVRSSGEIVQILPNRFDEAGQENYLRAGQTKKFPAEDAPYTFNVDGPQGLDKVIAVASKEPLDTSQLASFGNDPNFASSNQGEQSFAQGLSIVIRPKAQDSWVTDTALFYVGNAPQTSQYGTLDITSSPSGAAAYVDGQYVGITPVRFGTTSGSHTVRLELAGYSNFTTTVNLSGGQTLPVSASLNGSRPNVGTVVFESSPRGAEVYVNGQLYGVTPTAALEFPEGSHQAQLRASGYSDTYVDFTVAGGSTQTVSVSLSNVGTSSPMLSDALDLKLYPGATVRKLEQRPGNVKAEFETRASIEAVFEDLQSQLALNGWQRSYLETKGQATKLEAVYTRLNKTLTVKLDAQGNSGKYKLDLEF